MFLLFQIIALSNDNHFSSKKLFVTFYSNNPEVSATHYKIKYNNLVIYDSGIPLNNPSKLTDILPDTLKHSNIELSIVIFIPKNFVYFFVEQYDANTFSSVSPLQKLLQLIRTHSIDKLKFESDYKKPQPINFMYDEDSNKMLLGDCFNLYLNILCSYIYPSVDQLKNKTFGNVNILSFKEYDINYRDILSEYSHIFYYTRYKKIPMEGNYPLHGLRTIAAMYLQHKINLEKNNNNLTEHQIHESFINKLLCVKDDFLLKHPIEFGFDHDNTTLQFFSLTTDCTTESPHKEKYPMLYALLELFDTYSSTISTNLEDKQAYCDLLFKSLGTSQKIPNMENSSIIMAFLFDLFFLKESLYNLYADEFHLIKKN
jgi:hypothetical protein